MVLEIPLESDPPWLSAGIGGLTAASSAAFIGVFSAFGVPPALGLLPGMTLAVFAGSGLARWGRRRGASAWLRHTPQQLGLRDPRHRVQLIDLAAPFAAVLVVDPAHRRRMVVLSQRAEPVVIYEPSTPASATASNAQGPYRDASHPEGPWASRTVTTDLQKVAISSATAHVYTLREGESLDALLGLLGPAVDADAPWFSLPTAGGAVLTVSAAWVTCGAKVIPRAGLEAAPYAIQVDRASIAGIGFGAGEGALLLFGCEEAFVAPGAVVTDLVPDAYVSPATFELLRVMVPLAATSPTAP